VDHLKFNFMKRLLILFLVIAGYTQVNAQEKEKFRFDIRLGYAAGNEFGDGVMFNLEPKWSIDEKINVGFRIGGAALAELTNPSNGIDAFETDIVTVYGSYLGTIDYYFYHKDGSPFAVFGGAGIGYVSSANVIADFDEYDDANNIETDNGLGGMLRVGFDYFKFRLAAEYNFAPEGQLRDLNNNEFGTVKNGYFGISLGFYFGGGKWKNVTVQE
jgi:hypothetical protein